MKLLGIISHTHFLVFMAVYPSKFQSQQDFHFILISEWEHAQ